MSEEIDGAALRETLLPVPKRWNGLAIASLVLGLVSVPLLFGAFWLQGFYFLLTSIPAILLGHLAKGQIAHSHDPVRGYRAGAILALVGVVNLPIIKFSVDWWNTLHQPATISLTGAPTVYVGMLWPLVFAALGYTLVFAAIVVARTRAAVMERRIRALLMARADEALA